MARRTVTVVYDYNPDKASADLYGSESVESGAERIPIAPTRVGSDIWRIWAFRLARATTGYYSTSASPIIRQQLRGGALVRAWRRLDFYSEPTDTTVEVRLHNGSDSIYWDGGAWVTAGASDWNTPTDAETNFSSLSPTRDRTIALEWRLSTADDEVTPVVYGGHAAAWLVFGARSGDTAAETLADGWLDDLVHRWLIPTLQSAVEPEVTDERVTSGSTLTFDYSAGVSDSTRVVSEVTAVYRLDLDPEMSSPLSGSWDGATKIYTLNSALPDATRYAARLTLALEDEDGNPTVVYTGDSHYVASTLPMVIVESIRLDRSREGSGSQILRNAGHTAAVTVPEPSRQVYVATILCQSADAVSVFELVEACKRAFGGQRGANYVSDNTGMPILTWMDPQVRQARGTRDVAGVARFGLTLRTPQYLGSEGSEYLLTSLENLGIQVGYGTDVEAPAGR